MPRKTRPLPFGKICAPPRKIRNKFPLFFLFFFMFFFFAECLFGATQFLSWRGEQGSRSRVRPRELMRLLAGGFRM